MTAIYKDVTSLLFEVSGLNDMVLTQRAGRQTLKKMPVRTEVELQPEAVSMPSPGAERS